MAVSVEYKNLQIFWFLSEISDRLSYVRCKLVCYSLGKIAKVAQCPYSSSKRFVIDFSPSATARAVSSLRKELICVVSSSSCSSNIVSFGAKIKKVWDCEVSWLH